MIVTPAATSAMRRMPQRSCATIASMSPGCGREQQHADGGAQALHRHGDRDDEPALRIDAHDVGDGAAERRPTTSG